MYSFTANYASTIYSVIAYEWWLCQVDVHMAEMYGKIIIKIIIRIKKIPLRVIIIFLTETHF